MLKRVTGGFISTAGWLILAGCLGVERPVTAQTISKHAHVPSFSIRSPAFGPGAAIPSRYTCDGSGVSPPLSWRGVPRHTASLVLIVDDPDAPGRVFTHWLLFNLPATARALAQGQPQVGRLPNGAVQGRNDFGGLGYGGPCPPSGQTHHYRFSLYALGTRLRVGPGPSKEQVLRAMRGHILAKALLIGTYRRVGSELGLDNTDMSIVYYES